MKKLICLFVFLVFGATSFAQYTIKTKIACSLLNNYTGEPKVLEKLKIGSELIFIEIVPQNEHYFKVKYKEKTGFIPRKFIEISGEIAQYISSIEEERKLEGLKKEQDQRKRAEELEQKKKEERRAYLDGLREKYGKYALDIQHKRVSLGMTTEMVLESIGQPNDKTVTKTEFGTSEIWIYGEFPKIKGLYFLNDKLETIHEN